MGGTHLIWADIVSYVSFPKVTHSATQGRLLLDAIRTTVFTSLVVLKMSKLTLTVKIGEVPFSFGHVSWFESRHSFANTLITIIHGIWWHLYVRDSLPG